MLQILNRCRPLTNFPIPLLAFLFSVLDTSFFCLEPLLFIRRLNTHSDHFTYNLVKSTPRNPTKMHRDKMIARILLIFSVVNIAFAAPAVLRRGHPDSDAVLAASEKRQVPPGDQSRVSPAPAEPGPGSTFSGPSGGPHPGSVVPPPGTPEAFAHSGVASSGDLHPGSAVPAPGTPEAFAHSGPLPQSVPGSESGSTRISPPQSPPSNPTTKKFFTKSDLMKSRLKLFGGAGAILVGGGALLYGLHKLVGPSSHTEPASQPAKGPAGRDLASSDVAGRDTGTLVHSLLDHPQPRKTPVSRALANLRDEDLQLLNVLAHRALESLV